MNHLSLEMIVSIAASVVIALMVAAGAVVIGDLPSDVNTQTEAPRADMLDPLTFCEDDGERVRCIRADT